MGAWCSGSIGYGGHEITTPNAILDMQARGIDVVFNPNKVKITIDHVSPAKDTASAIQGKIVREWSKKHDIEFLVAGENFGCGSSREHAPWALEGAGIRCVIAPSFARIFENNMFANGLLCVALPKEDVAFLMNNKPKDLEIDLEKGTIHSTVYFGTDSCGKDFKFPISDHQKDLIRNGGSVGVMLKLATELQKEGKI